MNTFQARSRSGQKVRHISHGYIVLVDERQRDVSKRVPGEIHLVFDRSWTGIQTSKVDLVFVPDEGTGKVELKVDDHSVGYEVRDDDDEFVMSQYMPLYRKAVVTLDFGEYLDKVVG